MLALTAKHETTTASEEQKLSKQQTRGETILENKKGKLLAKVDAKRKAHDEIQHEITDISLQISAVRMCKNSTPLAQPKLTKAQKTVGKQKMKKAAPPKKVLAKPPAPEVANDDDELAPEHDM